MALMSLLGLLGLTRGRLIDPRVVLCAWFAGEPAGGPGIYHPWLARLRGHLSTWPRVSLGRVIALEMVGFDFPTILAILGAGPGEGGKRRRWRRIGWGWPNWL
jgi:hypothetical protein